MIRKLELITSIMAVFFLSIAVILVAFNVVGRYVFNYGAPWCEEVIRYSVIFATFFGLSLAIAKNQSMKIDILLQITKNKVKYFINILGVLVEFIVLWFLVYFSYLLVSEAIKTGQITPSTDYPIYIAYFIVALGVLFCAIRSIEALINALREKVK
ncbi:MAG: TRAP transporter small permease [Synergistota bacterium]|nr:TRAP transporter small permease [Synergistota bacterium]